LGHIRVGKRCFVTHERSIPKSAVASGT
jgi:hypothetical protein